MSLYVLRNASDIILLGDIMLDHNIEGHCNKIANESPIPVVNCNKEYYNLGGCGNVLMNLIALGANNVFLFSRIGADINGGKLKSLLPSNTISHLIEDSTYITITKNRVYSQHKLLCRFDNELLNQTLIEEEDIIVEKIKDIFETKNISSVIFSDYNKGFLTESLCQKIINLSNIYKVCTIVDPKNNYKKYINCTVIKPNKAETLNIFKLNVDKIGINEAHNKIKELVNCKTSVITLAEEGITAYNDNNLFKCKEYTEEIIDVTGAGDIVCSVLGILYSQINDINLLLKIANHLASISISHLGVYIINSNDLINTYRHIHKTKVVDLEHFPKINKKIVFTNGCFDLIHAGHMELFKFCKNLGDIVVVCVNSDNSIKRLKGQTRPIYNLVDRIKILEGIEYIDYIIPFDDDTPIELIKKIAPYYLVKGGDYTKDNVIGKEYTNEVIIFNYIDGKSTTNTINILRNNKIE